MIAVLVVLGALPIGYFCRDRVLAYVAFSAAFAHLYAFQTSLLVMEWVNGSDAAFTRSRSMSLLGGSISYFAFTTLIYVVGFALVRAGQALRTRRKPA